MPSSHLAIKSCCPFKLCRTFNNHISRCLQVLSRQWWKDSCITTRRFFVSYGIVDGKPAQGFGPPFRVSRRFRPSIGTTSFPSSPFLFPLPNCSHLQQPCPCFLLVKERLNHHHGHLQECDSVPRGAIFNVSALLQTFLYQLLHASTGTPGSDIRILSYLCYFNYCLVGGIEGRAAR